MSNPRTIPLLPCADIDEIEPFFAALGFHTTYRQLRPYAALGLRGHGFDLQYYGLTGHTPESSHSSCLVIVDDTGQIWEEFATGLRQAYGKLPITGFPRITRPRARKNADGFSGFSLVDPAGNWLRFFSDRSAETSLPSRLGWRRPFRMRSSLLTARGTSRKLPRSFRVRSSAHRQMIRRNPKPRASWTS